MIDRAPTPKNSVSIYYFNREKRRQGAELELRTSFRKGNAAHSIAHRSPSLSAVASIYNENPG